jgi:cysteine desulfurase
VIGASAKEIVWTSGATESINLALKGVADFYKDKGNHIITAQTEHKAVLDTCKRLEQEGCEVTTLPVEKTGLVRMDDLAKAIRKDTILVSLMAANNEVGTVHPVEEIGRLCKERGVLFHTDATQAVGKLPVDVEKMGIDLLSISGHKMYGPKGVGALYVRRRSPRVRLMAQMDGGGHERGMRSGTLNVPGIVGFGKACELAQHLWPEESLRLCGLRQRLYEGSGLGSRGPFSVRVHFEVICKGTKSDPICNQNGSEAFLTFHEAVEIEVADLVEATIRFFELRRFVAKAAYPVGGHQTDRPQFE